MIWPLFKFLGQKLSNFFVGILVETMTPKGHFEINWPLVGIVKNIFISVVSLKQTTSHPYLSIRQILVQIEILSYLWLEANGKLSQ